MLDKYPAIKLLSQRYGFGTKMSYMVLKYLGISSIFVPNLLPINDFYHKLSFFFSSRLLKLDNYLMNFYILKQTFLKKIKVYRGFRLLRGYPVNGQRTRSNYKTSSKKPYFYSFYFI
jgi:ribosomal protein S13